MTDARLPPILGSLKHLLTIDALKADVIHAILDNALQFINLETHTIKPAAFLQGKTVVNLFFEPSTRTRSTFELAAKRLSADILNVNLSQSATLKGETLLDTLHNIQAMQADIFVVRHAHSGAQHLLAKHVAPHVSVLNAGDGWHAHPTQALLDMFTIRHYKKSFSGLRVAIVGDILHSRVARSQIAALNMLGAHEVRVIAPKTLLPKHIEQLGTHPFYHLKPGLKDVDVIILLRLQKERMQSQALLPGGQEYFQHYGLNEARLKYAKPDALVMHPGPINRGVEMDSDVADGPQSVILKQVHFGVAVRMAVMAMTQFQERTT